MRFILALCLLFASCAEKPSPVPSTRGLTRGGQFQALRDSLPKIQSAEERKNVVQRLGDLALELGDAESVLEYLPADAAAVKQAKSWMDAGLFPAISGSPADLAAKARAIKLTADSPFAERAEALSLFNRAGRLYFVAGDRAAAGKCVAEGTPLVARILETPHPSLYAFHLAADHDDLYGDMLFANRHWGDARTFFVNNVSRFKLWKPENDYTRRRRTEAEAKVKACEKKMLG